MKKNAIILILFFSISVFLTPFILADDNKNPFTKILDVLNDILIQLKIIAEKNETIVVEPNITVQPPQITVNPEIIVEGRNEMAKRGNIFLEPNSDKQIYVALPNGNCSITISTNIASYEVSRAKSIDNVDSSFNCPDNYCSRTLVIDDEFYMIRIKDPDRPTIFFMNLAYNCV